MSVSSGTTRGGRANRTGTRLEQFVHDTLVRCDYSLQENRGRQFFLAGDSLDGKRFRSQVHVGDTIYNTKRIVDFLIFNDARFLNGLIIECKWQQSSGSVDEKFPYLIFNIVKTGIPSIILLDGGGYKPAAKEWLSDQVPEHQALIGVYDMAEFQREINNGLLD